MLATGNNRLTEQELSIRIFSDGFSFSTPHSQKEVKAQKGESLLKALEKAFTEQALLRPDYEEVHVYADFPSTRIPLDEFRSEEAQALYRLTFGKDSLAGMKMHYEMLPALEIIEVFVLDEEVEQLILRYYPHATIHSYFGQLINRMLARDKRRPGTERCLYAHGSHHHLYLFTYAEGKLQFANSFETNDISNQLYFLLYVWKQLGLRPTHDICVLIGKNRELEAALKSYLRYIETL